MQSEGGATAAEEVRAWRSLARNRSYRLLLSAGLVSLTGDWIYLIGLSYYVYKLTASPLALGFALIAAAVPQILFASVAGVFADRWDRRLVMVVVDLLLAAGLLPLLAVHHADQIWVIYVVMAVESTLKQFFTPAASAFVPSIVSDRELVSANALTGQSKQVARVVGSALGGLAVGLGGLTTVAFADAGSFVVSALLLVLIRVPAGRQPEDTRRPSAAQEAVGVLRSTWREWHAGLVLALQASRTRTILIVVALAGFGEGTMDTLFAPFVRNVLHGSGQVYGLILASQAIGGVIGGVATAATADRVRPRVLWGWSGVAFGAIDLALFCYPLISGALWPAFLFITVVGLPCAAYNAASMSVIQQVVPDMYLGRMFGALAAMQGITALVAIVIAGSAAKLLGIVPLIASQGVVYVLGGMLVLTRRRTFEGDAHESLAPAANTTR